MSHPENTSVVDETEESLIQTAQRAISQCRWVVGECASKWTQRHARGRTDADFGQLVGLSGDQIYQRRRVWETFSDVRSQFASLKWSHFYSSLNWDDAADCLQWAEETQATVAEMKAWRRALRGEDLTSEPEAAEAASEHISYLSGERAFVQDPAGYSMGGDGSRRPGSPSESGIEGDPARMGALARELDPLGGDNYAPFHKGAIHPPTTEAAERPTQAEVITPEQLARRLCSTIERCNKALNDDILEQLDQLPGKLRQRLMTAVEELHEKLSPLKA
ncbi:MAG: hypothetical protein JWN70_1926 [Planctomycetaceae bacterium]|nr:hypothetical protein [Planctomycetaceae bacterium]